MRLKVKEEEKTAKATRLMLTMSPTFKKNISKIANHIGVNQSQYIMGLIMQDMKKYIYLEIK